MYIHTTVNGILNLFDIQSGIFFRSISFLHTDDLLLRFSETARKYIINIKKLIQKICTSYKITD